MYYIYTLKIKNKLPCLLTVLTGVVNLLAMIIFIKSGFENLYFIEWTTVGVMNAISLVFTPIYTAKCLEEKWHIFYSTIFKHLLSLIVMSVVFVATVKLFAIDSCIYLILIEILLVMIGVIYHILIVLRKSEIKHLIIKFKSILKR